MYIPYVPYVMYIWAFTQQNACQQNALPHNMDFWSTFGNHGKIISELSNKPYRERLKILHLPTCKYRWYRGDMIELLKTIKGIYDSICVPHVNFTELSENLIRTRGNKFKLIQHHCNYDLRKLNFTNRVIPIWNSLSNHVVSDDTINTFKDRLDKFWANQDVLYDYKSYLHGIGNRSIIM